MQIVRLCASLPLILLSTHALGQDLWLAGLQAQSGASYAYLGRLVPADGRALGQGWVHRFWLDHVRYAYQSGEITIHGLAPGASYGIGHLGRTETANYAAYAGLDVRYTQLTPNDAQNRARGDVISPYLAAEVDAPLWEQTRIETAISVLTRTRAYWMRARLRALPVLPVSIEVINQGDPSYHKRTFGIILPSWKGPAGFTYSVRIGATRTGRESSKPFVGVDLSGATP